ncbi:MAG: 5-formyltetrahydrofolate cyclo-ligase [Eubacteriales bacterium]
MNKKSLRKEISAKKAAMSPAEITAASQDLLAQLVAHPLYQSANSIYGYMNFNQEVQTIPMLEQAIKDGKKVAIPKVYGDKMEFIWMDNLNEITPGYYNIPEPIADSPIADDETALVLMPGLAFDRQGNRTGYGGGFYDKYLEQHPNHSTLAMCFAFQLVEKLDVEDHDIPVDGLLVAKL